MRGVAIQDSGVLAKHPLENTISAKRHKLQDLKSLLEDRGGHHSNVTDVNSNERNQFKRNTLDKEKAEERLKDATGEETSNIRLNRLDNKGHYPKSVVVISEFNSNNFVKMCSELRFRKGPWCFSRFKTILFVLLVMGAFMDSTIVQVEARSAGTLNISKYR